VLTTPAVDMAAGAEVPIWLAAVVTVDPTALTAPRAAATATAATGLVLPEDGGEPVAPLPPWRVAGRPRRGWSSGEGRGPNKGHASPRRRR
jgi:hypothetical protein